MIIIEIEIWINIYIDQSKKERKKEKPTSDEWFYSLITSEEWWINEDRRDKGSIGFYQKTNNQKLNCCSQCQRSKGLAGAKILPKSQPLKEITGKLGKQHCKMLKKKYVPV